VAAHLRIYSTLRTQPGNGGDADFYDEFETEHEAYNFAWDVISQIGIRFLKDNEIKAVNLSNPKK